MLLVSSEHLSHVSSISLHVFCQGELAASLGQCLAHELSMNGLVVHMGSKKFQEMEQTCSSQFLIMITISTSHWSLYL